MNLGKHILKKLLLRVYLPVFVGVVVLVFVGLKLPEWSRGAEAQGETASVVASPTATSVITNTMQPSATHSQVPTIKPSETIDPTSTPMPTEIDPSKTPIPIVPTKTKSAKTPKPMNAPSATPDYAALMQMTIEAGEIEREHKAAMLALSRDLLRWICIAFLIPITILATYGVYYVILLMQEENAPDRGISQEPNISRPAVSEMGANDEIVHIEIKHENSVYRYKYPVPVKVLVEWCKAAVKGDNLGINAWTGGDRYFEYTRGADNGNPRSYDTFLEFWFKYQILERQTDAINSPILVTSQGVPVLRYLAERYG